MITEDYVSFEVAKLLKEKGFDEKCRYIWKLDKANDPQDTDGISKVCAEQLIDGSFIDNSDIKKVAEYGDWFEDYHKAYLCPTLQMTMKWLRTVHKLHITVSPYLEEEPILDEPIPNFKYSHYICKENEFWDVAAPVTSFDTYEQAADEAIKYCLTNLI